MINHELKYKAKVVREFGELPEVECIISQINQVVMKLLINATHGIEIFGRTTIRTRQEGDTVIIEVQDNGKGISPEHRHRLLKPEGREVHTCNNIGEAVGSVLEHEYVVIVSDYRTLQG